MSSLPFFFKFIATKLDQSIKLDVITPENSITYIYYMAVSHKDWELQNLWIWLAEIDIGLNVDFPI